MGGGGGGGGRVLKSSGDVMYCCLTTKRSAVVLGTEHSRYMQACLTDLPGGRVLRILGGDYILRGAE